MNIIFGPVHSRRFGTSLGIDLSPSHKQCNFDCLYCELAPAPTMQAQSKTVSVEAITNALQLALNEHHNIDVITLTANGEPTLYPYFNTLIDVIDLIKGSTETLILTNSATLTDKSVFNALLKLDQVKLSLDAISPEVFKKIDRPHESIHIHDLVDALKSFAHTYKGKLFIEILFVYGLNDSDEEITLLNEVLLDLDATRIDIGTIDRPPAYPVQGISYSELHSIAQKFDATLPINIASRVHAEGCQSSYSEEAIINTLDKRPLTPEDVEILFDTASKERLQTLLNEGKIVQTERSNVIFYVPKENLQKKRQKA